MRILITGGAGFIGSHLAEACLARGDEVYIIDNLSTGSQDNIKHLQDDPRYAKRIFITQDTILNPEPVLQLTGTCDAIFHMAAAVGVEYILNNPLDSIRTNIRGTDVVLDMCAKFKKRVLIASTSEVYGKHLHAPLVETDNIIYGPSSKFRWSYAAAKLMDEFTAMAYHRSHGLAVFITRLFNTVGPRQTGNYGMVIPRFVSQALAGKPITVYGDGSQTRTFSYVRDVVWALLRLMDTDAGMGEVYNIGGTEEISMLNLAERVKTLTGSSSPIELVPYKEAYGSDFEDMQRRVPGSDKIARLINFEPKTSLDKILNSVVDYMH